MDGWMDGSMDGWMDGCIDRYALYEFMYLIYIYIYILGYYTIMYSGILRCTNHEQKMKVS